MSEVQAETRKITNIDSLTVSAAVLGSMFGLSDRRVRELAEIGVIVRVAKGKYNLTQSVKNYVLSLSLTTNANSKEHPKIKVSYDEEKAMHERAKRQIAELKYLTMKGELHKAEDIKFVIGDMLSTFRSRLLGVPAKLAPVLVDRSEIGFIKSTLTKEVIEVLNELKDYDPADFYSDEYVEVEDDDEQ